MNLSSALVRAAVVSACLAWSVFATAAPVAGPNVNMVTGTKFPEGDPSLTKQNEESHAVSSRSPRHLFGAANDYRQVPALAAEGLKGGQAWIQLYKSVDGGESWRSTPLAGCPVNNPQCNDPTGLTAALKAKNPNFAADPTVRPGPYGTFFLSLIAGQQGIGGSGGVVAVQRFVDKNNDVQRTTDLRSCTQGSPGCTEVRIPDGCTGVPPACTVSYVRYKPAEDPILPDKFTILQEGTPGQFNDKPWNAADVPGRPWNAGKTCKLLSWTENRPGVANVAETVPAFSVYVSYAVFVGQDPLNEHPQMHVAVSNDCGNTFSKSNKLTPGNLGANSGSNIAIDPLTGTVYIVWRNFDGQSQIYLSKSTDGGATWTKKPIVVATFNPYDQGTTGASFRTLAFPTIAVSVVGTQSRVHVAWSQRKAMPAATPPYACQAADPADCDARVVMSTSLNGGDTWPAATPVDSSFTQQYETKVGGVYQVRSHSRGHQVQPAMTFAAGKLLVTWLDQRLDHTEGVLRCPAGNTCTSVNDLVEFREGAGNLDAACTKAVLSPPYGPACNKPEAVFTTYISDGTPGLVRRHTLDVFAAMASPADVPNFASSSARVSQYAFGSTVEGILNPDGTLQPTPGVFPIRQKEINPPNLPMFANGRAAFIGDYIDAAGQIIVGTGETTQTYKFNVGGGANGNFTTSGLAPVFHVSFTDNRDVIPPLDGNWATPTCLATKLTTDATGATTGSTNFSGCATPGYAGNRNQNVYTAIVSENSLAFANANSKLLSTSAPRGFVVTLQNLTDTERTYTLALPVQASGVTAAFDQAMTSTSPLTVIVQPRSSSTRTVWAKVNDATLTKAKVLVQVASSPGGSFSSLLVLNADPYAAFVTNGDGGTAGDLAGNDLGNVVLSNAVLTNNALSNNALTNNVLTNNALTNAVLSNVMLTNAVLSNFQIQNLDPSNAALTNNVLTNNALSNVVLTNAVLSNNALSNAVLSNAVLTNSALNAALTNLDPANVALSNAVLSNNALTNVVLSNNTVGNAMLSNAALSNAALSNAALSNAALSNNVLTNNALSNNVLTNNVLTNAPLIDVGETAQTAASLRAIEAAGFELVGSPFTSSDLAASDKDFRETSFTVRNRGNTDATLAIKLMLRDAICTGAPAYTCTTPSGYKLQLILRKVAFTPTAIPPTGPATTFGSALRIGMTQRNAIISNIGTLPLIDPSDPNLGKFLPDDPRAATLPLAAGEFAYATIRAIGVGGAIPPDPADLLRWGVKTVSANSVSTDGPLLIRTLNFPVNSVTALQDPGLLVNTIGGAGLVSGTAICTDAAGTPVSIAAPSPLVAGPPGYVAQASVPCAQAPIVVSDSDGLTSTRTAKLSFTPKYWGEFYTLVSLQDGSVSAQTDRQVIKVVVQPAAPVFTYTGFPTQLVFQQSLNLTPLVASTSPVPLTFSASGSCFMDGDGHTLRTSQASPPDCSVSISQLGNETYAPRTEQKSIFIDRASQTIAFSTLPIDNQLTFGNAPTTVVASVSSTTAPASGLPVTYTSVTPSICTTSGTSGVVTIAGAGTCQLRADQGGDANYKPAPTLTPPSFNIKKADQNIALVAPSSAPYNASFMVSATSTSPTAPPSGIPITFGSSTTSVCTVSGATVTILAVGTCRISADQVGNGNYNAAPQVARDITITKANQNIVFGAAPGATFGDPPVSVSATSTSPTAPPSGTAIIFSSQSTSVCTTGGANGATVTIVAAGTCTIAADQAGSTNYNAAPQVTQSFNIAKAPTTTVVTVVDATYDGSPHGGTASVNGPAGLNQSLTVSYTGTGTTTYGPSATAPINAGTYSASATYAQTANYLGSSDTKAFTINKAPTTTAVISSFSPTTFGQPVTFTATVTGPSPLTGTVHSRHDGQTIVGCVASPLAVDQAQCVINTLGVGTHAITAEYSGDGNHLASTSPALTQAVTVTTGTTTPVLAAGRTHTCALNSSGAAQCWGRNDLGQLGDTTTTEQHAPVGVAGLGAGVGEITAGAEHSCALTAAGGIKCWGDNVYGQVGDGTTVGRTSPVDVSGLTSGIVLISAGFGHTCAVTDTGGVKCWGRNQYGQLGDGTQTDRSLPVDVGGLGSGVMGLASSQTHTCALTVTGGVKCWGFNSTGQLGNGTQTDSLVPVDVVGLGSGVAALAANGSFSCALTDGSGVKCWGFNGVGMLGDGTTTNRLAPVDAAGLASGVSGLTAGGGHVCALTIGGGMKCWGYNGTGQLGDGTTTNRWTPVDVSGMTSGVSLITGGGDHTCALLTTGEVKCWGYNVRGQLGDGTTTNRSTATPVPGLNLTE